MEGEKEGLEAERTTEAYDKGSLVPSRRTCAR